MSPSLSGHNGQGSTGISTDSECPTTTQLRVIGSFRSSMKPITLKRNAPRLYSRPDEGASQQTSIGAGHGRRKSANLSRLEQRGSVCFQPLTYPPSEVSMRDNGGSSGKAQGSSEHVRPFMIVQANDRRSSHEANCIHGLDHGRSLFAE